MNVNFLFEEIIGTVDEELRVRGNGWWHIVDGNPHLYYKYDDVKRILYEIKEFYGEVFKNMEPEIIEKMMDAVNEARIRKIEEMKVRVCELKQELERND